jgi:hypothetical protein
MKYLRQYIKKVLTENFKGEAARKIIQAASDAIENQGYQVGREAITTMLSLFEATAGVEITIISEFDFLDAMPGRLQYEFNPRSTWPWQTLFIIGIDDIENGHVLGNIHQEIAANEDRKKWKLTSTWDPEQPHRLYLRVKT